MVVSGETRGFEQAKLRDFQGWLDRGMGFYTLKGLSKSKDFGCL